MSLLNKSFVLKCYQTIGNEPGTLFRRVTFFVEKVFLGNELHMRNKCKYNEALQEYSNSLNRTLG